MKEGVGKPFVISSLGARFRIKLNFGLLLVPLVIFLLPDLFLRICEGFDDAEGTKEFLFALPRFARDEVR